MWRFGSLEKFVHCVVIYFNLFWFSHNFILEDTSSCCPKSDICMEGITLLSWPLRDNELLLVVNHGTIVIKIRVKMLFFLLCDRLITKQVVVV